MNYRHFMVQSVSSYLEFFKSSVTNPVGSKEVPMRVSQSNGGLDTIIRPPVILQIKKLSLSGNE